MNSIWTLVLKLVSSNDLSLGREKPLHGGKGISFGREDFILCSAHPPLKMLLRARCPGRDKDPSVTPPTAAPRKRSSRWASLRFLQRDVLDKMLLLLISSLTVGPMILKVRRTRILPGSFLHRNYHRLIFISVSRTSTSSPTHTPLTCQIGQDS